MNRRSAVILLAAFFLFGYGLTACGNGGDCDDLCHKALACDQWEVGTVDDCVDWCNGEDDISCTEACQGIDDCTVWANCMDDLCWNIW